GQFQYFARLVDQLHLLSRVPVGPEPVDRRDQIEGDRMREVSGLDGLSARPRERLLPELGNPVDAGARHRLVTHGDHAAQAARVAAERHGLADRALRRKHAQLPHRELALLEDPERRLARGAGGADHGDRHAGCHQYWASTSLTIRSAISFVPTVTLVPDGAMS